MQIEPAREPLDFLVVLAVEKPEHEPFPHLCLLRRAVRLLGDEMERLLVPAPEMLAAPDKLDALVLA
jgi:hypothetical protein